MENQEQHQYHQQTLLSLHTMKTMITMKNDEETSDDDSINKILSTDSTVPMENKSSITFECHGCGASVFTIKKMSKM